MGSAVLIGAVLFAAAATLAATAGSRFARPLLAGAAVALWIAAVRLVVAMVQTDLAFAYVADHSRRGSSPLLRMSGLWSGSEGSLLLFATVTATVLAAVPDPTIRGARLVSGVVVAGLSAALVFTANPFAQLDLPPLDGRGMTPILEHPAMIAHPPLLYLGTILSLVPALLAQPRARRRVAAVAFTILTVALGLGAVWAYVELGWGGWWAWDPVENVALLPWLLLAAGFHAPPASRQLQVIHGAIWPLVFAGVAMTRTSLRTSVHAFADAAGLAWWLWPIVGVAVLLFAAIALRSRESRSARLARRTPARWLLIAAVVVIALGTFRPFLPGAGTEGWFFARMLFVPSLLAVVAMGIAPRWKPENRNRLMVEGVVGAGLGLVLAVLVDATDWFQLLLGAAVGMGTVTLFADRGADVQRWLAHGGMILVFVGILGGTASTQRTVRIEQGASATIAGHTISNTGVDVRDEAHVTGTDIARISATFLIDESHTLTPSIGVYRDRALRLAEAATRSRPHKDIQLILRSADDAGTVVVTVNVRPLNQMVWWGAAGLALAGLLLLTSRFRGRTNPYDKLMS